MIDEPTDKQIEIYKAMTPGRRLEVAGELYQAAWELKSAWLSSKHPEWSEERIQKEVRDIFLYART
ncbi:MAG: hypothetical protein GY869_15665 [Planctomycetes bacterium]|nr:hypothetical protein [Planctomycetota bacterium]